MLCRKCPCRLNCLPAQATGAPLSAFEGAITQKKLTRGSVLVRIGDPFRGYYAIREGTLKAVVSSANGDEGIGMFLYPGDIAGLGAVTHRWPKSLVALEPSQVCWIPESAAESSTLRSRLTWLIGVRLRRLYLAHMNRASQPRAKRLAGFLIEVAGRVAGAGESGFRLPMTQADIGSYLGLTQESTNRAFRELEGQQLIEHEGRHVRFVDAQALLAYAGNSG